jgi:hypothetical protein
LERRGNAAAQIENMRSGGAAAQDEDAILQRVGFVGAEAEFTARIGDPFWNVCRRKRPPIACGWLL